MTYMETLSLYRRLIDHSKSCSLLGRCMTDSRWLSRWLLAVGAPCFVSNQIADIFQESLKCYNSAVSHPPLRLPLLDTSLPPSSPLTQTHSSISRTLHSAPFLRRALLFQLPHTALKHHAHLNSHFQQPRIQHVLRNPVYSQNPVGSQAPGLYNAVGVPGTQSFV